MKTETGSRHKLSAAAILKFVLGHSEPGSNFPQSSLAFTQQVAQLWQRDRATSRRF